ncbi:pentatricopeptide repeat-containing protein At1g80270, mitochondrial-like [Camellia sinensis]|uniref:pentatricopeptide repeat-containing protein At1g80270, mitochondrial-like n=1 Tax=Camellia sinensis TaxID=4442 RepID=UPI001035F9FB|nr:pentatricopeptide repeat-containing protein At1g80270, mitochondrial-like [Camellia sinensis]XP_028122224.1 pentatricopeptide repeat-containing protein At1g80270, mitochondrial-like [Camellia sinensis]
MWALRRAANPLRNRGFSIKTSRASCVKSKVTSCYLDDKASNGDSCLVISDGCMSLKRFYSSAHGSPKFLMGTCSFSSQADTKSSAQEEDDLEDGFSELETPASADMIQDSNVDGENEDELISEPELSEEEDDDDGVEEPQNELELSDTEADVTEKRSPPKRAFSTLFQAIVDAPGLSVQSTLDKYVEEGNDLSRSEISLAMLNLRKRRMYVRALQLSEWLESTKQLDFVERDYASRLDLIAKVRGLQKAENYIEKIPKSSRGEVIYRTLLANCVSANDVKKTEEVFNKMRDLEFPITCFACNQLLILYRRFNKKKIADVLLLMEKENVKPTLFTYKFLIETKGQSNEITGMDQIFETMKADGIEPDLDTHAILAKHYVSGGLNEKAEAVLKEMEGDNIKEKRWACRALLPLYASLGKSDEVGRIWKVCESNPKLEECMAAILAWGKLKKIEEAEAVFDRMSKTWKRLSSKHYCTLLKVYADNKMLNKGKDLVKRMVDSGSRIDPLTLDALVRLYVGAGEVEKADSILQKAIQQSQMKPMFGSYMSILDQYAKRGDIHNSEKMFHRMRQVGFVARLPQFQALLQAYVNAKAPAYGIRERMKADNVFPNKVVAGQLAQVDAFRKTAASDLLLD